MTWPFQSVLIGLVATVGLLAVSSAAPPQETKPDFKLGAEEFAKEVYQDPKAALEKYKGKAVALTGQAVNASKLYSPRGFGLYTDVKASRAKGVLKNYPIAFEVDLPPEKRPAGWGLRAKQKVVVTAELAEVTDTKIRLTNATYKKAE